MKPLKRIALAALAASALIALSGAGTASATTLEVTGVTQNGPVLVEASLAKGSSAIGRDTAGFSVNTCTESSGIGISTTFTGTTVTGAVAVLVFAKCAREPVVTHKGGTLHVEHIAGTTNGTVVWSGAEWTTPSVFGTLLCKTGPGTHIGTLTGVSGANKHATMDINAQFSCSGVSLVWTGTYTVTTPTGLGVSA